MTQNLDDVLKKGLCSLALGLSLYMPLSSAPVYGSEAAEKSCKEEINIAEF